MRIDIKDKELLSAYLDDELSQQEKAEVEKLLQTSLELKKQLEDLKEIKILTQRVKRIPESPFFETRLMSAIENQKTHNRGIRRWVPAISLVVVTIAVMVVFKFNPEIANQLWNQQKEAIAGFYKQNLQPVLYAANLTNDDIFNFAFNNELPLDNSRKQYLLLGYDDKGKEFFEIRKSDDKLKKDSYKDFISAVDLNPKQKETVDSIISSYGKALESQVLVNDKNTVAINPNLWNYRKALFADLLVAAQKLNIKGFNRIIPDGISDGEKTQVVNAVEKLKTSPEHKYIFVTPDSVFADSYQFDFKQYENEMAKLKDDLKNQQFAFNIKLDSTLNHINTVSKVNHNFKITVEPNICRVDIPESNIPGMRIPDMDSINSLVEQATNNIHFYAYKIPKIEKSKSGLKIQYFDNDTIRSYEVKLNDLNMDSLAAVNPGIDMYKLEQLKKVEPFSDSMLVKYQFDKDYYQRYYSEDDFKKQMEALQKELEQLSRQTKEVKIRVHKQVAKSPVK
jgi:hypothetical protein